MIEVVEVTYEGPYGAYTVPDFEGASYEFVRGVALRVPEIVAEHLLDVPGHTFSVGDEVEAFAVDQSVATVATGSTGSGSGSGSGDDPEGVNATSSYGGGS